MVLSPKDTEILSQSTFNFLLNLKILNSKNNNIKIYNMENIIRNSGGIDSIGGSSFKNESKFKRIWIYKLIKRFSFINC